MLIYQPRRHYGTNITRERQHNGGHKKNDKSTHIKGCEIMNHIAWLHNAPGNSGGAIHTQREGSDLRITYRGWDELLRHFFEGESFL